RALRGYRGSRSSGRLAVSPLRPDAGRVRADRMATDAALVDSAGRASRPLPLRAAGGDLHPDRHRPAHLGPLPGVAALVSEGRRRHLPLAAAVPTALAGAGGFWTESGVESIEPGVAGLGDRAALGLHPRRPGLLQLVAARIRVRLWPQQHERPRRHRIGAVALHRTLVRL